MSDSVQNIKNCCGANPARPAKPVTLQTLPMFSPVKPAEEVCCGSPVGPQSSPFEKPGYRVCAFVEDFLPTPAGPVPQVKTRWNTRDRLGALLVRLGIRRNEYKVAPGLYAMGRPDKDSVVLVTANYKLSFDTLRKELGGLNAWLLVLDTRGINVWCAAGKKTFGTEEVIRQVKNTRLEQQVGHKKLVLPQLGAPGVSALQVKKGCGFEVVWGPIRAEDLKPFLHNGLKATAAMRRVTFNLRERVVLTPVEITQTLKPLAWVLAGLFLLSGFGPGIFSWNALWQRGLVAGAAVLSGLLSGTFLTPVLLPWVPGRAFALKGALLGLATGIGALFLFQQPVFSFSAAALMCMSMAIASYTAMNFTGCTPYTSPSGVEKEMRKAIPLQALAALIGFGLWIVSAFLKY